MPMKDTIFYEKCLNLPTFSFKKWLDGGLRLGGLALPAVIPDNLLDSFVVNKSNELSWGNDGDVDITNKQQYYGFNWLDWFKCNTFVITRHFVGIFCFFSHFFDRLLWRCVNFSGSWNTWSSFLDLLAVANRRSGRWWWSLVTTTVVSKCIHITYISLPQNYCLNKFLTASMICSIYYKYCIIFDNKPNNQLLFQWIKIKFLLDRSNSLRNRFLNRSWLGGDLDNLDKVVREDSNLSIESSLPPSWILQILWDDGDNLTRKKVKLIIINTFIRESHFTLLMFCKTVHHDWQINDNLPISVNVKITSSKCWITLASFH